jgi:orotate phosphoribosyltransferase
MTNDRAKSLMQELYELGMFKTWYRDKPEGWTLVSGLWSPVYLQLRQLCSYPSTLDRVGSCLSELIESSIPSASRLVGIAYSGIPIAVATSLRSGIPANLTRKLDVRSPDEAENALKLYGDHNTVEGELTEGDCIVLVDDLVTRFDSKLVAAAQVRDAAHARGLSDITCSEVAVVIDREQGAESAAVDSGFRIHSLIKLKSQGLQWLEGALSSLEMEVISSYFIDPQRFQDPDVQQDLLHQASKNEGTEDTNEW